MIAARHAMVIHGRHVARDLDRVVGDARPTSAACAVRRVAEDCVHLGGEPLGLADRHPPAGLLALLHGHAAQRRPGLKVRILKEGLAHVVAGMEFHPLGRRLRGDAPFERRLHRRQHLGAQMTVHLGEEVEPFDFIVGGIGKHPMPAHRPVVRRAARRGCRGLVAHERTLAHLSRWRSRRTPPAPIPPAVSGEESQWVLRHWRLRSSLQNCGVTGG